MKKYSKAIAAILAALICLGMCVFSAYADENDGQQDEYSASGNVDDGGGESQQIDDGQPEDPYYPPESSDDGQSEVPYYPPESSDDGGNVNNGGGGENVDNNYYESSEDTGDNSGGYVYYDSDGNTYSNTDDVYVGGGQSYVPPVSTAPPAALYEAEKKIDVSELSKNDWGDIAKMLQSSDGKESDGDDFAFIQKNTSKTDNGHWIIIVGAVCIALSITGFIYLIASTVNRRKKIKAGNITKNSNPQKNGAPYRASNDYDDGYGSSGTKQSKSNQNPTGHYTANNKGGKSKGGKRYR